MILAIESSGAVASAALVKNGGIIALTNQNNGLTHSRTLLPMVEDMMKNSGLQMNQLTGFAVSAGPGSFTGLRIGMAAVKGMAQALSLPCVAVSSLEAQAYGVRFLDGVIGVLCDAHFAGKYYFAKFAAGPSGFSRISPDEVISPEEASQSLSQEKGQLWLVGDGAERCYNLIGNPSIRMTENNWSYPSASNVGLLGEGLFEKGLAVEGGALRPFYLTLPQAERERLEKLNSKNKGE